MPFRLTVGGSAQSVNAGLVNNGIPVVFTMTGTAATDWLATARFRAGFLPAPACSSTPPPASPRRRSPTSNSYADDFTANGGMNGSVGSSRTTALRTGLVIGAGAEWALATHWKLRAEYLHAEFGRRCHYRRGQLLHAHRPEPDHHHRQPPAPTSSASAWPTGSSAGARRAAAPQPPP
ncbi:MAG: hypothetical protein WDM84_05485 [Bauldia sp.]